MSWSKKNKCLPGGVLLSNHNDLNSYTNLSLYRSLNTVHIMATYLVFWFSTQLQTYSSVSVLHICFCTLFSHHQDLSHQEVEIILYLIYTQFLFFVCLSFCPLSFFGFFWGGGLVCWVYGSCSDTDKWTHQN